jgi:hypothetical protein
MYYERKAYAGAQNQNGASVYGQEEKMEWEIKAVNAKQYRQVPTYV